MDNADKKTWCGFIGTKWIWGGGALFIGVWEPLPENFKLGF